MEGEPVAAPLAAVAAIETPKLPNLVGSALIIAIVSAFWIGGSYILAYIEDNWNVRLSSNQRTVATLVATISLIAIVQMFFRNGLLGWCVSIAALLEKIPLLGPLLFAPNGLIGTVSCNV